MTKMAPAKPPRAWQRMLSGRRLDLLNPSPLDVEIEDIAHGLARMARWNGQTTGAYAFSVAQHSLLVEDITRQTHSQWPVKWQLTALLHDGAEYVIGDLISPFKAAIGLDYKTFELALLAAIHLRFGLPAEPPKSIANAIKAADKSAAYFEATQLAGFNRGEAAKLFGLPVDLAGGAPVLIPQSPPDIQTIYLARFGDLLARL